MFGAASPYQQTPSSGNAVINQGLPRPNGMIAALPSQASVPSMADFNQLHAQGVQDWARRNSFGSSDPRSTMYGLDTNVTQRAYDPQQAQAPTQDYTPQANAFAQAAATSRTRPNMMTNNQAAPQVAQNGLIPRQQVPPFYGFSPSAPGPLGAASPYPQEWR